jgi:hypothetical protein
MIPPDAHAGDAPRRWRQSSRSRSPTPWRRFSVACTALRPSGAIVCLASAQAGDAGEPDARRSHPRASSTHPPPLTCTDSKRIWPEHSHRPLYGSRHGRGASARPCFLSRRLHHQSVGVLASRAAFPRTALAFAIPGERHCRFCLKAAVGAGASSTAASRPRKQRATAAGEAPRLLLPSESGDLDLHFHCSSGASVCRPTFEGLAAGRKQKRDTSAPTGATAGLLRGVRVDGDGSADCRRLRSSVPSRPESGLKQLV